MKTTKDHIKYWKERKIDWRQAYLSTWDHPHRELIIKALKEFRFMSIWEVGCGPGANLLKIRNEFPHVYIGGSDINEDAIELAKEVFQNDIFRAENIEDMLMSDKAVDIMLSDATLIYIGPRKIRKVLKELTRVTRNGIVLCEFHEKNPLKRWWFRFKSGYNAYDYRSLLEKAGYYDIRITKIPKEAWPGTPWEEWGHIITAKLP